MGAIKNGLRYALDGKGASEEIKTKYLIPWNSTERAITGGAIFIGSSYINVGQNTIYLQKFDVNNDRSNQLFSHQYMTNILAPYSESNIIYKGYQKSDLLNTPITLIIPVFDNMPEVPTANPNINLNDFQEDNTRVYCNGTNVNIRTGPSTSYESIMTVTKEEMTRIAIGIQNGDKWDKVILDNGIVGYIYQTYLTKAKPQNITEIILDKQEAFMKIGDTIEIKAITMPNDAINKNIIYQSENSEIATVNENGIITAMKQGKTSIIVSSEVDNNVQAKIVVNVTRDIDESEIKFNDYLIVKELIVAGIDYEKNTVADIKASITTDLEIEIVNYKNEILKDIDIIGTGSKIRLKENGQILREYQIVLYGDIDGNGIIDAIDILVLQRHILEIRKIDEIFSKAGNIDKNGKEPTAIDLLLIQRHILELQKIKQGGK